MIELKAIKKSFKSGSDTMEVLKGVDLSIKKGEMIAIMGRSGVGKSTLLYILAGLEKPSSGSFCFNNLYIDKLTSKEASHWRKNHVGFILQNNTLIEEKTVFENIALPLRYSGKDKSEIKNRVYSLIDELKLNGLAEKYPSKLSGGQAQRVGIGRALANNPDLILADEPTGSLDEETEKVILNIFKRINQQGKTFILVTHDETVGSVCDRILRLKDGRLV